MKLAIYPSIASFGASFGFLLFIGIFPFTLKADAEQDTLKVGIILPLTGDAASIGKAFKNGIALGHEKLSATAKKRLELIYEDDALKPSNTISAFNKLLTTDGIDVVINASSGTANALAPLAERRKIPFIAIASDPKIVARKKYVVNFWVTPDEEARVLIPAAVKRGYRRIARISTIQEGVFSMRKAFDSQNGGRIDVVLDEEFPPEVRDFKPFIAKIKSTQNLDAVLPILLPGQCGLFARQLRQMGVDLPLFSVETFEDSNEVKLSGNALLGAWYVSSDDPDSNFVDQYRKRFPGASFWGASNGHDAILLLGAAAEQSTDSEDVNRFLHTVKDFSGALGTYSATDDNRFSLPAAVKKVTTDGFERLPG